MTVSPQESAGTPGGAAVDIRQEPAAENGDLEAKVENKGDLDLDIKRESK